MKIAIAIEPIVATAMPLAHKKSWMPMRHASF
jgi:hypothetical protein